MSTADAVEEIAHLALRGWRLLPCAPRGKTPLLKCWPVLASSDLATIREWAAQFPECNWGVATGPGSRVFVLDVDGEAGRASLAALEAQHGPLPVTLTSKTGRADGGEHRWFKYPSDRSVRSSTGTVGTNLDVQSGGKLVIVPPSVHASGRHYRWVNPEQTVAEGSKWLLDLLSGESRMNHSAPSGPVRVLVEGQRNDGLFRYGCAMRRRGAAQDEIERRLHQKNERECKPSLQADEVRKIAASAARYPVNGPDPLETAWGNVLSEAQMRGYEQFVALARCLQLARPGLTIALPLKRIGKLMACDWTQARRWKDRAIRDGWLRLKERYIPHVRAALYTFHEISASTVPLRPSVPLSQDAPLAKPTNGLVGQAGTVYSGTPIVSEESSCNNLAS